MKRALLLAVFVLAGPAWAASVTLPEYERVVLDNGTVLLLSEKRDVPLIGLRAIVRGGSVADPADLAGVAELLTTVMQKGAGDRDAAEFAEAAAAVGGSISASAGLESVSVSAEFLSRDAELMIELVSDVLMRPTLSEEQFNQERQRSIGMIQAAKGSDPSNLMSAYGNAFIFGDHPYGRPGYGSETSLGAMEHSDIVDYYDSHFGGDRLVVAVAGDFDVATMKAQLTAAFGAWEPAAEELTEPPALKRPDGRRVLLIDKPGATQTYFWIGNVGVTIDYPQRAELNLANTIFGGRFASMLVQELRVDSGLTYSVGSSVARYSKSGSVTIRSFTETSTTVPAIDKALEVLERFRVSGLDEKKITSARNYIMGQFPPSLETASSLAGMFAYLEVNGLGREYIDDYGIALEAATPVSVHNMISEVYPESDDLVFVLLGDADAIREDISKYGPVTEMSITEPQFRPSD